MADRTELRRITPERMVPGRAEQSRTLLLWLAMSGQCRGGMVAKAPVDIGSALKAVRFRLTKHLRHGEKGTPCRKRPASWRHCRNHRTG